MKKLLLLCLLGGVCLFSNELSAQNIVADPPGTNFLHRFMSLRGGETRSDLFSKGFSLIDDSISLGQEGDSPSARMGKAAPVLIYGEFMGMIPDKEVYLYTWPRYTGNGFIYQESTKQEVSLDRPTLQRGGAGEVRRIFNASSPSYMDPFYFLLRDEDTRLTSHFLAFPGDSLMLRWYRFTNRVSFSGPQAKQFELQHVLAGLTASSKYTTAQNIIVKDREKFLAEYNPKGELEAAKKQLGRHLEVVVMGKEELDLLEHSMGDREFADQVERMVEAYREDIPATRLALIQTDVLSNHYALQAESLSRLLIRFPEWLKEAETAGRITDMLTDLDQKLKSKTVPQALVTSGYIEFWYHYSEASASAAGIDFFDWIVSQEAGLPRDVLFENYLLRKERRLPDFDEKLGLIAIEVKDPVIKARILGIQANKSAGATISSSPLLNSEGNPISLTDYPDQVMLLEFWAPGCGASKTFYEKIMKGLHERFQGEERLQLVSIGVDVPEGTLDSFLGEYYSDSGINLQAEDTTPPLLTQLGIRSYPSFVLVGRDSRLLKVSGFPDNDPKAWVKLLEETLNNEFKD
ncbi:TlpA family protein disulfide reductase [Algoriphagus sp. PAP.12]|uniref:TlpA family protein disulfide reductase n=1 Tax=Algoriphagus sp. PAP.12 TaxID=2996678 RepID=UPI00227BA19D|nr:thioredoxin-like domain-containing protein [Algoriphagus sp. PAP.12]